jgi:hypothetical protein
MSPNQSHQETISSNAGSVAVIANAVVKALGKQLPSSQEKVRDDKLDQAGDLVKSEVQSMIGEDDLIAIQGRITYESLPPWLNCTAAN